VFPRIVAHVSILSSRVLILVLVSFSGKITEQLTKNTALWCKFDNNNVSVENFPFVVGEKVGLCKKDTIADIANIELVVAELRAI
jgi:hypothetical protein